MDRGQMKTLMPVTEPVITYESSWVRLHDPLLAQLLHLCLVIAHHLT
jgi:hypothetical protein